MKSRQPEKLDMVFDHFPKKTLQQSKITFATLSDEAFFPFEICKLGFDLINGGCTHAYKGFAF